MKTAKSIIIWTIIIFITITLLTMKEEAASDGFDTYGFPFTFYDNFEGKCDTTLAQASACAHNYFTNNFLFK